MRLQKPAVVTLPCWRVFLSLGLVALAASGPAAGETETKTGAVSPEVAATALFDLPATEWWEPPSLESENGVLRTTLEVAYADHLVRDHTGRQRRLHLRSYNGALTGPTLKVRAGDTLYLKLDNRLPPNPTPKSGEGTDPEAAHHAAMASCPNEPHAFNTTNLHTHGLHISPQRPADDVFLSIEPDQDFDFVFPILPAGNPEPSKPAQHYPGTFWYHAHRHGSTAMQLASGMAGALLVLGDVDELPEIRAAGERLFVFQQIAYGADGRVEDFGALRSNWREVVAEHTRINGRLKPRFTMRPRQIERWRMIDAGIFGDVPFEIVPRTSGAPPFRSFQIAADGITFPHPRPVSRVELAPGYRADLLVQAPARPGIYYLRKKPSEFDFTAVGTAEEGRSEPAGAQILAEIVVGGDPCRPGQPRCGTDIPVRLPAPVAMLPDIRDDEIVGPPKEVVFSVKTNPRRFLIEQECYDPEVVLPKFKLTEGTAEEWVLENTSVGPHPFHIHVNAFQILEPGKPRVWKDTVIIPPEGTVRIRTRFERFVGDFVTHCHILTHEDLGMMQRVRISTASPTEEGPKKGGR